MLNKLLSLLTVLALLAGFAACGPQIGAEPGGNPANDPTPQWVEPEPGVYNSLAEYLAQKIEDEVWVSQPGGEIITDCTDNPNISRFSIEQNRIENPMAFSLYCDGEDMFPGSFVSRTTVLGDYLYAIITTETWTDSTITSAAYKLIQMDLNTREYAVLDFVHDTSTGWNAKRINSQMRITVSENAIIYEAENSLWLMFLKTSEKHRIATTEEGFELLEYHVLSNTEIYYGVKTKEYKEWENPSMSYSSNYRWRRYSGNDGVPPVMNYYIHNTTLNKSYFLGTSQQVWYREVGYGYDPALPAMLEAYYEQRDKDLAAIG